jgi:hypothetical protein
MYGPSEFMFLSLALMVSSRFSQVKGVVQKKYSAMQLWSAKWISWHDLNFFVWVYATSVTVGSELGTWFYSRRCSWNLVAAFIVCHDG